MYYFETFFGLSNISGDGRSLTNFRGTDLSRHYSNIDISVDFPLSFDYHQILLRSCIIRIIAKKYVWKFEVKRSHSDRSMNKDDENQEHNVLGYE